MRNITNKFVCFILIIILFVTCIPMTVYSYESYNYSYYDSLENVLLLQNEEQVYLVGTDKNFVSIDGIYPDSFSISLELNSPVVGYNLFNNTFVFACYNNSRTEIALYDISTDIVTSFNINKECVFSNYRIAYSNGLTYLCDTQGNLYIYNTCGKLVNEHSLNTTTHSLICNYDGDVYAVTHKGLVYVNESYYEYTSFLSFSAASKFVNNNDFVDFTGRMYRVSNRKAETLIGLKSDIRYPSGGVYKNFALISSADNLYAIDINSDEIKRTFKSGSRIEQICVIDDTCVLFMYENRCSTVQIVRFDEFKATYQSTTENDSSQQESSGFNDTISSDVYHINFEKQYISGISASTTVAEFKRNIHYDDFDVEFFRYGGTAIKSGNIGTATFVRFYNDYCTYEFELCIKGDLTGEGNINSRDLKEMFDIILDNITVTGVFFEAADMDDSGEIDLVDMVLINRAANPNLKY